jgi:hypothetical protein
MSEKEKAFFKEFAPGQYVLHPDALICIAENEFVTAGKLQELWANRRSIDEDLVRRVVEMAWQGVADDKPCYPNVESIIEALKNGK